MVRTWMWGKRGDQDDLGSPRLDGVGTQVTPLFLGWGLTFHKDSDKTYLGVRAELGVCGPSLPPASPGCISQWSWLSAQSCPRSKGG